MIETSIDMIFETGGEPMLPSPPDIPEMPPFDDCNCIQWEDIFPWAIGIAAVGAGILSWQLVKKYNEIPPSI